MKLIKITADNEVSTHEFPTGNYSEQNKAICELIGNECTMYEHVLPARLYSILKCKNRPTKIPGQCVSMLVDEEFLYHNEPKLNPVGCFLYESDRHHNPILGTILLVGEEWGGDGIDFCGIEESVFDNLLKKINDMAKAMRDTEEEHR